MDTRTLPAPLMPSSVPDQAGRRLRNDTATCLQLVGMPNCLSVTRDGLIGNPSCCSAGFRRPTAATESEHHRLPVAWRTSSRNRASAASPRCLCSAGVISGTSPSLPRRCGFFAVTMVTGSSDGTTSATCRCVRSLLAVTIIGPAIVAACAFCASWSASAGGRRLRSNTACRWSWREPTSRDGECHAR